MTTVKEKLKLGATEYDVAPLTLGTLKKLGVSSAKYQGMKTEDASKQEEGFYDTAFEVIAYGLGWQKTVDGKDEPDVERVKNITGATLPQVLEAQRVVYRAAGLIPTSEAKEGKKPEGEAASTG